MLGRHSPKELLPWFHWGQLIVPSPHQVALIDHEGIQILHTCLRLLRKDWADWQRQLCEKYSQLFLDLQQKYQQFSVSFAFELTAGQWSRCTENWASAFSEFQQHLFRDMIPNSLWTILFHRISLLLGTWTNKWPLSYTKLLCKYGDDFSICQAFFFIAFDVTGNAIDHRHQWNSSCESFWCFSQVAQ